MVICNENVSIQNFLCETFLHTQFEIGMTQINVEYFNRKTKIVCSLLHLLHPSIYLSIPLSKILYSSNGVHLAKFGIDAES